MAISSGKIELVPSNEGQYKEEGSVVFEDASTGVTVVDLTGNLTDQVYTVQYIPFMTLIPVGELLNDGNWYNGYGKTCLVHELKIIVDKNTIPSVSGMKIIGYVTSTSIAGGNSLSIPVSPNGDTTTNVYPLSDTIMFKLWREFAWEFQENQEPYKPFLRKAQGGDIETFANTKFPNTKLGENFEQQSFLESQNGNIQTMYNVAGLNIAGSSTVLHLNLGSTIEVEEDNWDEGFIDNGHNYSIQTYPLTVKIQHNEFNPNLDGSNWAKIKGLITLY